MEFPDWDKLIQTHPEATIFHGQQWANVLARSYQYTPFYLIAADQNRLWGLLPILEVNSWITGKRGVSLPFTDRCSPLTSQSVSVEMLVQAARDLGGSRKWRYLELRGLEADESTRSVSYYEHTLDLTKSESELLGNLDSAVRRGLRKAQNENVSIETNTTSKGIESYYHLHQITRKKHGLPPQPKSFFINLWDGLIRNGNGKVFLASIRDRVIAGAVFLHFGDHCIYKFGASDPAYQGLRPNNLVMWQAISDLKRQGAKTLSFGRTSLHQDGLRRFKRGFGATESLLHYAREDLKSGKPLKLVDRATGIQTNLFRLCPKVFAQLVGKLLYPHVG